jgi:hypothetical protein
MPRAIQFPAIGFGDMVEVQRPPVDELGIGRRLAPSLSVKNHLQAPKANNGCWISD